MKDQCIEMGIIVRGISVVKVSYIEYDIKKIDRSLKAMFFCTLNTLSKIYFNAHIEYVTSGQLVTFFKSHEIQSGDVNFPERAYIYGIFDYGGKDKRIDSLCKKFSKEPAKILSKFVMNFQGKNLCETATFKGFKKELINLY